MALSSGEAELYGLVKASAEGLGLQYLLADIGFKVYVRVKADASAALGVVERKGLGRLRHVHTNFLWVQTRAADKSVKHVKEKGSENPGFPCCIRVFRVWCTIRGCVAVGVPQQCEQEVCFSFCLTIELQWSFNV